MDGHIHLKFAVQCLSFVGFWPLKFRRPYQYIYWIYFMITLTTYVLLTITELTELYRMIERGFKDVLVLTGFAMFHVLGLIKIKVASGTVIKKLIDKVKATEDKILEEEDENIKDIYMNYVRRNYVCNKCLIFITYFCLVVFITIPCFVDLTNPPENLYEELEDGRIVYKERPLPLATWFPFDKYKYYHLTYIWQSFAITFAPTYITGCNNLFYGLIVFSTGQLKILQYYLIHLRPKGNQGFVQGTIAQNTVAQEYLRKCIEYHQNIIVFVTELSSAMRTFLLIDFLGCGMEIAVIGFQTTIMSNSSQLIETAFYLATCLTQLFFLYWYANETLLESVNICKAVWESKWPECDQSTKLALIFVTMRAQKPLTLSIGAFSYMSNESMMIILRYSYTYAMVMRRLYAN